MSLFINTTPLILVIRDDEDDFSAGGDMLHHYDHKPLLYYTV